MSNSKRAPTKPKSAIGWAGLRTERIDYAAGSTIFAQGDPADSVLYVDAGAVRLSVLSHAGKEAVIAVLDVGHFFGEGCLAGQAQRMATAMAMADSRSSRSRSRTWCGNSMRGRRSRIGSSRTC